MEATGVSHIAVCVRDLDKSLAFYRDILGMRVDFDEVQDTTSSGLPSVYAHSRKTRRSAHVWFGPGPATPSLVLTSHPGEDSDGSPIKLDQVGISHFSFTVRDVKALADELVSKGVELAAPLEAFTAPDGRVSSIFVYDPDGILLQFDLLGNLPDHDHSLLPDPTEG
jgi:catechol 2,3-dioxygenase-like lactoylglutathione lyase family enzyme